MSALGLIVCLSVIWQSSFTSGIELPVLYQWKQIGFVFPNASSEELAKKNKHYIEGNAVPCDVDVQFTAATGNHPCKRVFVTLPRFAVGVPITLATITTKSTENGPLLKAYPNYEYNSNYGKSCKLFTSVSRVQTDECNRLWVLDSGKIVDEQLCPPQLFVFDLRTDKLLRRYPIPRGQYKKDCTYFVTPIVDVRNPTGTCDDTFVYMADASGNLLVVYNYKRNRSWLVTNKYFFPDPDYGTITIAGTSFDYMDGVSGIAISPKRSCKSTERMLFFQSLASNKEYAVSLDVVNNYTLWQNGPADPKYFKVLGERDTQSDASAIDRNGNLFFGLMADVAIGCWDTSLPYNRQNVHVVSENRATLQFACGVKVLKNRRDEEELWILTNSLQKIFTGTLNQKQVNFRILKSPVEAILRHGKCEGPIYRKRFSV